MGLPLIKVLPDNIIEVLNQGKSDSIQDSDRCKGLREAVQLQSQHCNPEADPHKKTGLRTD